MHDYYAPVHQFEVRYAPLVNAAHLIKDIVSPYMQRVNSFQIQNENLFNQHVTLNFDSDSYSINIFNDMIIFGSNIGLEGLEDPNSFFKEPFLSIYEKIKLLPSFSIKNSLFYTICLEIYEDIEYETSFNILSSKYLLKENCQKILNGFNDIAITLDKKNSEEHISISYGPYRGIDDFTNRRIQLSNRNILKIKDLTGIFIEYKHVLYEKADPDFKLYRSIVKDFFKNIENI